MKKYRVNVQGMTCTGCEEHVAVALENMGGKGIEVDCRREEAVFELPNDVEVERAKKAISEAEYQAGETEEVQQQETVQLGDEGDYDYIIIGSGGASFSSAIEAVKYGAKVAIIERCTVGGTCGNIGYGRSK